FLFRAARVPFPFVPDPSRFGYVFPAVWVTVWRTTIGYTLPARHHERRRKSMVFLSRLLRLGRTLTGWLGIGLLLGSRPGAAPGAAQFLYQPVCDPPALGGGLRVAGQQDWIAGRDHTPPPAAGVISTAHPDGGQQSLQVNGKDLTFFSDNDLYTGVYRPNSA